MVKNEHSKETRYDKFRPSMCWINHTIIGSVVDTHERVKLMCTNKEWESSQWSPITFESQLQIEN